MSLWFWSSKETALTRGASSSPLVRAESPPSAQGEEETLPHEEGVDAHARQQRRGAVEIDQDLHHLHVGRAAGAARAHARQGQRGRNLGHLALELPTRVGVILHGYPLTEFDLGHVRL